jgi:hypothetical protein
MISDTLMTPVWGQRGHHDRCYSTGMLQAGLAVTLRQFQTIPLSPTFTDLNTDIVCCSGQKHRVHTSAMASGLYSNNIGMPGSSGHVTPLLSLSSTSGVKLACRPIRFVNGRGSPTDDHEHDEDGATREQAANIQTIAIWVSLLYPRNVV